MSLNRKARRKFEKNSRSRRTQNVSFVTAGTVLASQATLISPAAAVSSQVVTSCADSGVGTLRTAITNANLDPDATVVSFELAPACDTITLATALDQISTPVDIQGPGANLLAIDGLALDSNTPVFNADSGATSFKVSGLTLIGSGIRHVSAEATVPVTDVVDGIVIKQADEPDVLLDFTGSPNATLTIENSTFTDNHSDGDNGISWLIGMNAGNYTFKNNTVVNNTFAESMISTWGNSSVSGQVISNTIVSNEVSTSSDPDEAFSGVELFGNLIANLDLNGSEMCNSVTDKGGNLYSDVDNTNNCSASALPTGAQSNGSSAVITDAETLKLGTLDLNGGTTPTLALLSGSPAIDYYKPGDSGISGTLPTSDQRTLARPFGSGYDVGAFEYQEVPTNPDDSESLADTGLNEQNTYLGLGAIGALAIVGGTLGLAVRRRKS